MKIKEPEWIKEQLMPKFWGGGQFSFDISKIPTTWDFKEEEWNANWRKLTDSQNKFSDPTNKQYNFKAIELDLFTRQFTPELIDAMRLLKSGNWGKLFQGDKTERNSVDYTLWNELFNKTGLNDYFGYSDKVKQHYGPSTAARYALLSAITLPDAKQLDPSKVPSKNAGSNPNLVTTTRKPITDWPYQPEGYKRGHWSDWLVHGFTLGSNLRTGLSNLANESKMVYPKLEFLPLYGKLEDNYVGQLQLNQAAAETRAKGDQLAASVSDLDQGMKARLAYEQYAQKLNEKATLLGAEAQSESQLRLDKINQFNVAGLTKATNYNNMSDAAAWNNILQANSKWNELRNTSLNDFVTNMYTDFGNWLKNEKKNKYYYDAMTNNLAMESKIAALYKDYLKRRDDITQSKAYQDWRTAYIKDKTHTMPTLLGGGIDESALLNIFRTGEGYQSYRDAYLKELENGLYDLYETINMMRTKNRYLTLRNSPYIVNNQIFDGLLNERTVPYPYPNYKSGGRVSRLIDYVRTEQKELENTRKAQLKSVAKNSDMLDKSLERINKQLLLMMRALFK